MSRGSGHVALGRSGGVLASLLRGKAPVGRSQRHGVGRTRMNKLVAGWSFWETVSNVKQVAA